MNMELYSRIFKNIRRLDLLIVISFFVVLFVNAYKIYFNFLNIDISAITNFVVVWFFGVFAFIIFLEIISFILFLKTDKGGSKFNLKKNLSFYFSEIFMFNSKSDKKVSGTLSTINIILATSFVVLVFITFITLYFYNQEIKHQADISNAKLEVVEQFREVNNRKIDD